MEINTLGRYDYREHLPRLQCTKSILVKPPEAKTPEIAKPVHKPEGHLGRIIDLRA